MWKRLAPLVVVTIMVILSSACSSGGRVPESQRLIGPSRIDMRSGNTYMNIQEFDNALESYKKVIAENPENIEALKNIADIYFFYAEENPQDAQEYYTKSHNYHSRVIESYNKLQELGRFPALREKAEDSELKKRACWVRLFNRNQQLASENNLDEALENFYDLVELEPDSTQTYIMIASIHQSKENPEKALEYFNTIAQKDQTDVVSRTNLAAHHYTDENYQEALRWYDELLQIEPENPENHYMKGLVLMSMEEMEDALAAFETAFELDSSFIDAAINSGLVAFWLDEDAKAIRYYKAAHELEPEESEWLEFLLESLNKVEDYEQMMTYGMHLYELDNENVHAVSSIVIAAAHLGETEIYDRFLKKLQDIDN